MNDGSEIMWKEAGVASFKGVSRNFSGGSEKNHDNLSQSSQSPGRDLKSRPPAYEAGVITTGPRRSVSRMVRDYTKQEKL